MSSLSALKQEKRRKEKELKQYEKRLKEVRSICGDMEKVCDDYTSDINEDLRKVENRFGNGLNKALEELKSTLDPLYQSGVSSDSDLSSCRGNLKREITRIENKIEDLRREIRNLEAKIAAAREDE